MSSITISIQQFPHAHDLPLPHYGTEQSAGLDLSAAIEADVVLSPGKRLCVPTGIAISLPNGFEAQIRSRSGLAFKNGVIVLNAPGTIDADYRGEILVMLINHGDEDFIINRGMRIAQMVIAEYAKVEWSKQTNLDTTERGENGFGSTGVQKIA